MVVPLSVLGQESARPFETLKRALALSDSQVSQLQRSSKALKTATTRWQIEEAASLRDSVLDDAQRAMLRNIEKVLNRWDVAALLIQLGLIQEQQWPGGQLCLYPIRSSASSDLQVLSLK